MFVIMVGKPGVSETMQWFMHMFKEYHTDLEVASHHVLCENLDNSMAMTAVMCQGLPFLKDGDT